MIYLFLIPDFYSQKYIIKMMEENSSFFKLRDDLFNWLDDHYKNKTTISFIKYFMFNKRDNLVMNFFNDLKDLGILQLLSISGFHINIFLTVFKFIFYKLPKKSKKLACNISSLIFVISYGYFLSYSVSILRILFTICFSFYFDKKVSTFLSCFLNIFLYFNIIKSFGFILSYGCVFLIMGISDLKINKIKKYLLINIICYLFTIFIQLEMNKQINILGFLYCIAFTPLVSILYVWILITMFIFPIQIVNDWIVNNLFTLVKYLSDSILMIKYIEQTRYIIPIYYSSFLCFLNFTIKDKYDCIIKRRNYKFK